MFIDAIESAKVVLAVSPVLVFLCFFHGPRRFSPVGLPSSLYSVSRQMYLMEWLQRRRLIFDSELARMGAYYL